MRSLLLLPATLLASTLQGGTAFAPLAGVSATSVKSNENVDLGNFLKTNDAGDKTMLVLGTYAADFNAVEYAQRLRYYMPELQKRGISKFGIVLNCEADAALKLVDLVDLPCDTSDGEVTLMIDPTGQAGRKFGVGTGWRSDDEEMSPYLKLFGMLFGLGAWATLPAVIGGYIGNPFTAQPWIEDAMAVGIRKKRWPDNGLELNDSGDVVVNKFQELPVVGEWKRRPLELATLRLQNMIDISIKNWKELAPKDDALKAGVLTQLGGCVVFDSTKDAVVFEWKDPGICAVANFENILEKVPVYGTSKDPSTSCNGCINIRGAQYAARFGFPSKIVLINGRPNASVLCELQNAAATASPGETFNSLLLKKVKNVISDPICSRGSMVKRVIAFPKSKPRPFENALQNAFQTIPRRTTS
eukprot:scaffold6346_cov116-Skeletonema_marinoi.AAC.5